MALSERQLKHVCNVYGGSKCCKYLDESKNSKNQIVHVCKKLSSEKKIIDQEVNLYLKDCKSNSIDPFLSSNPLGDNCNGYIVLKDKNQGYDA